MLAVMALRSRQMILAQQLARVRRNIAILDQFFERRQETFRWNRPHGGSICFPRMLMVGDTYQFCKKLVEQTGIMLLPSRVFQYGDRHVRIGFGREDLPGVLSRFEETMDHLIGM